MDTTTTTGTPGADPAQSPRKTAAATKNTAKPAPAVTLKVRVLRNGLAIAGGRAARGAVLHCTREAAEYHEARGEAAILGTA